MSQKVEELYQKYLCEKLDLIFETIEPYFLLDNKVVMVEL